MFLKQRVILGEAVVQLVVLWSINSRTGGWIPFDHMCVSGLDPELLVSEVQLVHKNFPTGIKKSIIIIIYLLFIII